MCKTGRNILKKKLLRKGQCRKCQCKGQGQKHSFFPFWRTCIPYTVKFLNIRIPEKLLKLFSNLNNVALPWTNESKRCRQNGEQCRPWSDCSSQKLRINIRYGYCSSYGLQVHVMNMSCSMTKPTKWHQHPAKTQISLGILPVWSESDPRFLHVDSEGSDDLSLWWPHVILLVLSGCGSYVF